MYKIILLGDNGSNNILIDVVANRGEDLRFPISSSSGFSSPFAFFPEMDIEGPCRISAGLFMFLLFVFQ
jgi:hypothetical protein